jgi:hypothetical protein
MLQSFGFLRRPPQAAKQLLLRRRIFGNKERGKLQRVVDHDHIHTKDGQDEQMLISIHFGRTASDNAARRRSVGWHDGSDDAHGWQADLSLSLLLTWMAWKVTSSFC